MQLAKAKVVKRDGKYYVYSKKGKKLGGPYDTREAALKRLREIEHFKTKGDMQKLEYKLFSTAASIIEKPEDDSKIREDLVKANKIERPDEDLLHVRFILCHEGGNNNKDGFLYEELEKNYGTAVHKDLNVEHTDRIVGVITAARFITKPEDASFDSMAKAEDFKPHIECDAVIYKYKFPEVADEVIFRQSIGSLRFSMETWFKEARCDKCEASFVDTTEYCEHLTNRFASGSEDIRWLIGLSFAGAGIVENPADKDAKGLSVAKLNDWDMEWISDNLTLDDLETLIMRFAEMLKQDDLIDKQKLNERLTNIINNLSVLTMASKSDADKITNNAKGGTKMPFEFASETDILASDIVKQAIKDAVAKAFAEQDVEDRIEAAEKAAADKDEVIEAKDEEIAKATERAEKAEKEVEDIKAAQAKKELIDTRFTELSEAGVKFSEDEDKLAAAKDYLGSMDEDTYANHKEMLLANLPEEKEEVKEEETKEARASEKEEDEVEDIKMPKMASAFDMTVAFGDDEFDKLADEAFGDVKVAE